MQFGKISTSSSVIVVIRRLSLQDWQDDQFVVGAEQFQLLMLAMLEFHIKAPAHVVLRFKNEENSVWTLPSFGQQHERSRFGVARIYLDVQGMGSKLFRMLSRTCSLCSVYGWVGGIVNLPNCHRFHVAAVFVAAAHEILPTASFNLVIVSSSNLVILPYPDALLE